jgi:DNA invertase Pin-like site-specific DNA recombinase
MKTCILYARVSSRRQAETFSLPTQLRELRAWAEQNGYTVVEEVADRGGKDSKRDVFDRPGVERIFDVCEQRHVDIVLAQERSRFGEYPIPEMISYRLAERGTRLRTPSDSEGEAGELMDLFTDWTSRRERQTTARRSRSRKLEQARRGYVVPSHTPTYGFKVAGERTKRVYEVEENHMAVVRSIFEMVGVDGCGNRTVAKTLNAEGIPTPPAPVKEKHPERLWGWRHQFVRRCVLNDAYRPHTPEEIAVLVEQGFVAPDVADRLDPEGRYGIWWYTGRDFEGDEHRVAVPVPSSGVPREVADAARAAVVDNVPLSGAGDGRFWPLLGGILFCGGCGMRMQAHAVRSRGRVYHYVRCPLNQRVGPEKCPVNARLPAEQAERVVWEFVEGLLVEPERMVSGMDALIEAERDLLRGDPEQEMRGLQRQLQDLDGRRERAQDAYIAGAFSVNELHGRQHQLDEAKEAILREMDLCENRGERLRRLVAFRDRLRQRAAAWNSLLEEHPDLPQYVVGDMPWANDPFARAQKQALENATPEQRRDHYLSLELRVDAHSKDELEISGIFGSEVLYICNPSPRPRRTTTPSSSSSRTTSRSGAGGSPRTSSPSTSGKSPSWRRRAS